MLKFRPVTADDFEIASPIMYKRGFMTTESSFVTLYMWSRLYNCEICIDNGDVFLRSVGDSGASYLFPYADDTATALLKIYEHERENGNSSIRFHSVTEEMKEIFENAFCGEFSYTERRNGFDYIYKTELLASLSGKKLHPKRNHVNKFIKKYEGRYSFSKMTEADIAEVSAFQQEWVKSRSEKDKDGMLLYENGAIKSLFENFMRFNLIGGVLRVDGKVCAYCIGSKICDNTVDVMVEKADYSIDGAYQMINKGFAEMLSGEVEFLNREDDMGLSGLRRAKLSYYPEKLIAKYSVIWQR